MDFNSVYQYWEWEMTLLKSIQGLHAEWLTPILNFLCNITMHGEMWIGLGIVLAIYPKSRKVGITMLCAMLMGTLTVDVILKNLVDRPRPFEQFLGDIIQYEVIDGRKYVTGVDVEQLGFDFYIHKIPKDSSFPSGHSCCGFAASVALFTRSKKAGIPAMVVAAIIVFARMYLFVHFPTDVLTGMLIGILCGIASFFIINAVYRKLGKDTEKLEGEVETKVETKA